MNIVTSICVDETIEDESYYPNAKYMTSDQRRLTYWKCVVVFFSTSFRCNPSIKHLLFTNDKLPVFINHIDVKQFLSDLQVEIIYLPFQYFKIPKGLSNNFKNAFYKLDVIKELGSETYQQSILLDSDCVWTKYNPELFNIVSSGGLLLYDVYERNPHKKIHGISRLDMGRAYKEADKDFPIPDPILFGGEVIGASSQMFRFLSDHLMDVFNHIIHTFGSNIPKLTDTETILDGDEHIASLVYNKIGVDWVNAKGILKRIWTGLNSSGASVLDLELTVWHLPKEKTQGIPVLVNKALNKKSKFWKINLSEFNLYLGKYLGVPKRESKIEKGKYIFYKIVSVCKFYYAKNMAKYYNKTLSIKGYMSHF